MTRIDMESMLCSVRDGLDSVADRGPFPVRRWISTAGSGFFSTFLGNTPMVSK